MGSSEVARLRQQIELEMEAMQRGMSGIAQGTARHDFIHARMERIGVCQEGLARQVGPSAASHIVCQLYMQTMEPDHV
ncbi:MAG TPA: hypothetical protein VKR06_16455 [Ktedonosporobacter sp.]|nr:hypothetical protein [Ktedonosporobacter sp.]